jgi:hypothetical protein
MRLQRRTKTPREQVEWNLQTGNQEGTDRLQLLSGISKTSSCQTMRQLLSFLSTILRRHSTMEAILAKLLRSWRKWIQIHGSLLWIKVEAIKNKQFKMEFKADYDAYWMRVLALENDKTKAYALFWEWCTKGMKNKLESWVDFVDTLENNPIELLKAIKQHDLNYQEHWYDMSIIYDAITMLLRTKHKEHESLQDYMKWFCVSRDVLESHMGGPIILTKVVEAMHARIQWECCLYLR